MEKLKHLVHPGNEKDDEVLYGSGRTSDPVHPGDTIGGHHVDPMAGNVNKPLPHAPVTSTGGPGSGSALENLPDRTVGSTTSHHHSHGVHGDAIPGELRHHYHLPHELHPTNPPPLEDPRIAEVIQFGHTPVEALRAAIETPVPSSIPSTVPVVPGPPIMGAEHASKSTTGPHQSSLLNKLDPRVDSNNDGSKPVGGYVPGTHSGVPIHTTAGAVHGSPTTTTGGPHTTNLANRLDPRVDPDHTTGSPLVAGTSGTTHHPGRDAAVLGGAAAAGGTGYGVGRHYDDPSRTSYDPLQSSSTTGPYSSGTTGGTDPYRTTESYQPYTDEKHHHIKDEHHHHEEKQRNTGFLDLLHRNKETHYDEGDNQQQQPYSATGTGTSGLTGVTYDNNDDYHHDRHRLHKDPPAALSQSDAAITTTGGGVQQPTYYDNDHHERHRLHKDPPKKLLEEKGILSTGDRYGANEFEYHEH